MPKQVNNITFWQSFAKEAKALYADGKIQLPPNAPVEGPTAAGKRLAEMAKTNVSEYVQHPAMRAALKFAGKAKLNTAQAIAFVEAL